MCRVVFVSTNKDELAPYLPSLLVSGGGTCVAAVETGVGRPATVLGKPSKDLVDLILQTEGMDPARTCMVGDRLNTDMLFGKRGGVKTLLVLSGCTASAQLEAAPAYDASNETASPAPDYVASSVATLLRAVPAHSSL